MLQKKLWCILGILLVLSLAFVACTPGAPPEEPEEATEEVAAPKEEPEEATEEVAAPEEELEVTVEASDLIMYMNVLESPAVERLISPVIKEKFGVTLLIEEKQSVEQIAALRAQQANPEVTLACGMVPGDSMIGLAADLYAPLDYARLPNAEGLYKVATSEPFGELGVGYTGGASLVQYYTPIFEENGWDPPMGYADFADPKYAGRVGLTSGAGLVGISMIDTISKAEGAPRGDVTPGIDFAIELVATGQVHSFPTRSSEINALMETGEIWIANTWGGGALQFISQGGPIGAVSPKEGLQLLPEGCHVLKGSLNQDVAHEVINLILGEEFQQEFTLDRLQFPMRPVEIPAEFAGAIPATEEEMATASMPDWDEWAEYREEWTNIWLREVEAGG